MSRPQLYDRERDGQPPRFAGEREEWAALLAADTLNQLPPEALIASIKHLARRLLQMTEPCPWPPA